MVASTASRLNFTEQPTFPLINLGEIPAPIVLPNLQDNDLAIDDFYFDIDHTGNNGKIVWKALVFLIWQL
jgi:hypothetical protein